MPNFDEKTGISYGCINQRSICPETMNDLWITTEDLVFRDNLESLRVALRALLESNGISEDSIAEIIQLADQDYTENYQNDFEHHRYEKDGYILEFDNGSMSVIMVIKSPYYTFCRPCSPCVPGAGDLDSICNEDSPGAVIAYCLGGDFFEDETAPYQTFPVEVPEEKKADGEIPGDPAPASTPEIRRI